MRPDRRLGRMRTTLFKGFVCIVTFLLQLTSTYLCEGRLSGLLKEPELSSFVLAGFVKFGLDGGWP